MKSLHKNALSIALSSLIFTGCATTVSTQSEMNKVQIPEQWQTTNNMPSSAFASDGQWWTQFGDARLSNLIETALDKNNNLTAAGYKLRQAQLSAGLAQNNLFPTISASASGNTSRPLDASNASSTRSYSTGVSVAYEVDLWGKLAQANHIKQWEAQATEQDLLSTQLSIEGTVAKLYWQLAYLNQKIKLGEQSVAYARKTLELVRVQYRAGAVSQLEVLSAERNLASQEATQEDLLQQRMVARNAMAIMFDAPPSAHISDEPQTLPNSTPPAMTTALPAEVLARRPDLQAAELRLRQSLGNINVARANFYPTFNLTARVGTGSNTLSQILSDPIGALALNLALPFLNWNENQLNLKISKAAYEQNAVNFRQTLYTALQDVDNALSAQNQLRLQGEKQRLAWQNAQKAERLYEVRYRAGGDSLKSWLDAQEARRQAESAYLLNRYNQYVNRVELILALGG